MSDDPDIETAFQQWALENTPADTVLPDDAFEWFEAGAQWGLQQ